MKKILQILLLALLLAPFRLLAQSFEVPSYSLNNKEDYAKYESDVLNAIDWIEATSWNAEPAKRDQVKAFLLKWIEGSPTVAVDVDNRVMKLIEGNNELLGSYLYGFTKYAITNKAQYNAADGYAAGVKAVLAKYKAEPTHKKNNYLEKGLKADRDGKLAEWIASTSK